MELEVSENPTATTYEWLSSNPLASSCGIALSNMYCASRDYNRVTQCTIGGVESIVNYAAGTAKPVYEKVVEKLEKPITTVDEMIAGNLAKLEEKYPVLRDQPREIATKGKDTVCSTLQAGQESLGNTRAGQLVGYGADVTITLAEGLVEKILPASDDESDEEEKNQSEEHDDHSKKHVTEDKRPRFNFRKRKTPAKEEQEQENDNEDVIIDYHVDDVSRSTRVRSLSHIVCYRSLRQVQRLQKSCMSSLQKLQASMDVLHYAQMMSSKVGEQKNAVTQALKDAETRFKKFLTKQAKEDQELNEILEGSEKDDEDIKWLLESGKRKHIHEWALEYSKTASKRVHELMQSFSGVTSYLPQSLQDGATSTIKQAGDVYATLKENNVPSELPWFVLSQISEIIETQIVYCKNLGTYIAQTLKTSFGKGDSNVDENDDDEISINNDGDHDSDGNTDEGEYESGSETFD